MKQSTRQPNLHLLEKHNLKTLLEGMEDYSSQKFNGGTINHPRPGEFFKATPIDIKIKGEPLETGYTSFKTPDEFFIMAYADSKVVDEVEKQLDGKIQVFKIDKLFPYLFIKVMRSADFKPMDRRSWKVKVGRWEQITRTEYGFIKFNDDEELFRRSFWKRQVVSKTQMLRMLDN